MIDIEELEGPVPINSGLPLAVYVPNREADEAAGCVMNDSHYRAYHITCGCCCTMENADEMGWYYASVSINDAREASENWDENDKIIEEGYALRFAKVLASAPTLLEEVKRLRDVMIYVEQRQPHPALEWALKEGLTLTEIKALEDEEK